METMKMWKREKSQKKRVIQGQAQAQAQAQNKILRITLISQGLNMHIPRNGARNRN